MFKQAAKLKYALAVAAGLSLAVDNMSAVAQQQGQQVRTEFGFDTNMPGPYQTSRTCAVEAIRKNLGPDVDMFIEDHGSGKTQIFGVVSNEDGTNKAAIRVVLYESDVGSVSAFLESSNYSHVIYSLDPKKTFSGVARTLDDYDLHEEPRAFIHGGTEIGTPDNAGGLVRKVDEDLRRCKPSVS